MKSHHHGLVFGKFMPFTKGHELLVQTALDQCEDVTVLVFWRSTERIPYTLRQLWIRSTFNAPQLRVVEQCTDLFPTDFDYGATWDRWIASNIHAGRWSNYPIDAVFTSEPYGDETAARLNATHVWVDEKREMVPISATKVRNDPMRYWEYIPNAVRTYYAKRVAIVGPESSGKTTLARELSAHFKTGWVPEYARHYGERYGFGKGDWIPASEELFPAIVENQPASENVAAYVANRVIICDTDLMCTSIWYEMYHGHVEPTIHEASKDTDLYDLTFLCGPDVPWEDDNTREFPDRRAWFHQRLVEELEARGRRWFSLPAHMESRMYFAQREIAALIG